MKFIGKLIKQSAQIEYKKGSKEKLSYDFQLDVLFKLLKKARKTQFGLFYQLEKMYKNPTIIAHFQNDIPIVTYNEFYESWLFRLVAGEKNVCWPGKINYFALSSGTTGAPSKLIPVSKQMIRSFQKTSIKQITTLCQLNLSDEFFQKQVLVVGGSTQLEDKGLYFQGDLSGILKKYTKKIATPFTKPSNKISDIKDWYKKLEKIVIEAPNWDIGIIAGIPSWCVLLMEEIIRYHNLTSIHDIWPNLQVYIHGGVFMEPYTKRLDSVCHNPLYLFDTYLASEGYFAYQKRIDNKSMQLLLNNGVFYEFIPFNSEYFNEDGSIKNKHKALTLLDVQNDIDYALVITTNAGLWRYLLGDTIRFTNVDKREFKIVGRTKQYLSLVGEHLSLDNIHTGLSLVCKELDIHIDEFTVYSDKDFSCHHWYISVSKLIDKNLLVNKLDTLLCDINDDYKSARKYTLNSPKITILENSIFYSFMEKAGKLGAQNKFPRVMNDTQKNSWLLFLNDYSVD